MFTRKYYRTLSILIIFALMFNATPLLPAASVVAAPLKSGSLSPQAQAANFHVHGSVRNRDGMPLSNVAVELTAYAVPYTGTGQPALITTPLATDSAGEYDWNFPVGGLPDPLVIRIEQTGIPAGYIFNDVMGLPPGAERDDKVIQIDNVSSGSVVNAGVFVDKRNVPFEFSGTTVNQVTGQPLSYANAQLIYSTTAGTSESVSFSSDSTGDWSLREYNIPHLNQFDVVTFTLEALPTDRPETGERFDYPDAAITQSSQGIVEDHKIHYRGVTGGTYGGNQLLLSPTRCDQPIALESEHFKILSCPLPGSLNYTPITYTLGVSNALEFAYPKLVAQFNRLPALLPGENKVIVNLGPDILVCSLPIAASGVGLPGQIWLKNNLHFDHNLEAIVGGVWQNPGDMAVTAAHELYHVIQWNYIVFDRQDTCATIFQSYYNGYIWNYGWWMEANSEWIQSRIHPSNYNYAGWARDHFMADPAQPLTLRNSAHEYGALLFPEYLSEKFGQDSIPRIWENHGTYLTDFVDTISAEVGGLSKVFPDFATANYLLNDPVYGYQDNDFKNALAFWSAAIKITQQNLIGPLKIKAQDTVIGNSIGVLGTDYAVITGTNLAAGAVLSLTIETTTPADPDTCIEKHTVRLLKFSPGNVTPGIFDVPLVSLEGNQDAGIKQYFAAEVNDFGSQVEKVVMIVNAIPKGGNCLRPRSGYSSQYTYTYKVLAENKPPKVWLEAMPPNGDSCTQPMPFRLLAVDKESGLDWVKTANPAHVANTLNYTAGQIYSTTLFTLMPGESRTVILEAGDRAGNTIKNVETHSNPGGPGCGDGNPDDNFSSASAQAAPISLPAAASVVPRIAVLGSGFSAFAAQFLAWSGEPASTINNEFDPVATVADYPILVIPSGGLTRLSSSASFRARLEEYARRGGVIIALDQQRGSAYEALPGGQLTGYGWDQDNSCYVNAFFLAASHPILSGFNRPRLDVHADGYFTAWPADATILLRRSANGQPGGVLYPFGKGWVFATTMYDDWGIANGQYAEDARVLMRGIIAWALHQGEVPQYHPSETVSLSIPITNTSPFTVSEVQLALITPERTYAFTQTLPLNLAPGQAVVVPFTTTATLPLGFWEVQVTGGSALYPVDESAAFIVSNPPASVAPNTDLSLSVNAPASIFIKSTDATFTFRVFNHTDSPRTATVRYGLPHHTWETGNVALYGEKDRLSQVLTVPAHGEASFDWTVPMRSAQDTV